jgi:hypothetical protein
VTMLLLRVLLAIGWGAFYLALGYALNVLLLARGIGWWSEGFGLALAISAAVVGFVSSLLYGEP